MAVTEEGKAYSFGRNDKGQLGHGDTMTRGAPTIIKVCCETARCYLAMSVLWLCR